MTIFPRSFRKRAQSLLFSARRCHMRDGARVSISTLRNNFPGKLISTFLVILNGYQPNSSCYLFVGLVKKPSIYTGEQFYLHNSICSTADLRANIMEEINTTDHAIICHQENAWRFSSWWWPFACEIFKNVKYILKI